MIHASLCLLAVLMAWRTPGVRAVAIWYAGIQVTFLAIRDPAASYGQGWYLIVAAVELLTAICLIREKSGPASYVRWVSLTAAAINIATYYRPHQLYGLYPYAIQCSEYARVACIIVFTNSVWAPLSGWYTRRQALKESVWLANWIPVHR